MEIITQHAHAVCLGDGRVLVARVIVFYVAVANGVPNTRPKATAGGTGGGGAAVTVTVSGVNGIV